MSDEMQFSSESHVANLHLSLPHTLLNRIDAAMESHGIDTRQDFAVLALLYALRSIDDAASLTYLGLEDENQLRHEERNQ
jgi:hypothetical protein